MENLSYTCPQLWTLLPETIKEINYLIQFKRSIKKWVCSDCSCKSYKTYAQILVFYKNFETLYMFAKNP